MLNSRTTLKESKHSILSNMNFYKTWIKFKTRIWFRIQITMKLLTSMDFQITSKTKLRPKLKYVQNSKCSKVVFRLNLKLISKLEICSIFELISILKWTSILKVCSKLEICLNFVLRSKFVIGSKLVICSKLELDSELELASIQWNLCLRTPRFMFDLVYIRRFVENVASVYVQKLG